MNNKWKWYQVLLFAIVAVVGMGLWYFNGPQGNSGAGDGNTITFWESLGLVGLGILVILSLVVPLILPEIRKRKREEAALLAAKQAAQGAAGNTTNPPNPAPAVPPARKSSWIGKIVGATLALALVGVVGWWLYHYGGAATSTIYTATTGLQSRGAYARETTRGGVTFFGNKSILVTRTQPQSVYIPEECRLHWYTKGPITIKFPSGKIIEDAPGMYQAVPEGGGLFTFWAQDEQQVQVDLVWDR